MAVVVAASPEAFGSHMYWAMSMLGMVFINYVNVHKARVLLLPLPAKERVA